MAKKSKKLSVIEMKCTETGDIIHINGGNRHGKPKLELMKFNAKLRRHTLHKEKK